MENQGKWFEHKETLVDKGLVDEIFLALDKFHFDVDVGLANEFEPLLIARHAQRLGELIDRCLAIRKDIRELEVLAVKAATDYELFKSTSTLDEQMDILRLQLASKASDQAGFKGAATTFNKTSTLESGLTEIAKGRDAALAEDLKNSSDIKTLTASRWKSLRDYQDAYHARHTEPGNAHNYGERAKLLLEVLTVLMREALARTAALGKGIKQVYQKQLLDVPNSVTLQTLDQFAVWALKTIQSLSRAAEQETVSEVIIPLVQPWLLSRGALIKEDDFNLAVSGAAERKPISLSFDLPDTSFLKPRMRLRGIALSFGNKSEIIGGSGIDRNQTADAYTRLAVTITTPPQQGEDGKYQRPSVLIGDVGLHATGRASMVEGTVLENLSPFGKWKLDIHPLLVWKDASERLVSEPTFSDQIRDLKLTLRFYVPGTFS